MVLPFLRASGPGAARVPAERAVQRVSGGDGKSETEDEGGEGSRWVWGRHDVLCDIIFAWIHTYVGCQNVMRFTV